MRSEGSGRRRPLRLAAALEPWLRDRELIGAPQAASWAQWSCATRGSATRPVRLAFVDSDVCGHDPRAHAELRHRPFSRPTPPAPSGQGSTGHGLMCTALAAGERFGVAGGSSDIELTLLRLPSAPQVALAGLRSVRDADVVSISQRIDVDCLGLLRELGDRGRGGLGAVLLLSAGNDALSTVGAGDRSSPCLLVGASTIPAFGAGETLAPYSNGGADIDICAPSGHGAGQDHAKGVLAAAQAGDGFLGEAQVVTEVLSPVTSHQELRVQSSEGFHLGGRVLVRTHRSTCHSAMIVGLGRQQLTLAELDLERIPAPKSVTICSRAVAKLAGAAAPGNRAITLDREISAPVGTWLLLVGHDGARECRTLEGSDGRRVALDRPLEQGFRRHAVVAVDRGEFRVAEGTSTSTALIAGVVGLMLSVNPELSPRDIRRLLRETAHWIPGGRSGEPDSYPRVDAFAAVRAAETLT